MHASFVVVNIVVCRLKPDYMSQHRRPLLSRVYNQKAYFSGKGIRTCFSFCGNEYANQNCVGNAYIISRYHRDGSLNSNILL
jgi:hypothetical protein